MGSFSSLRARFSCLVGQAVGFESAVEKSKHQKFRAKKIAEHLQRHLESMRAFSETDEKFLIDCCSVRSQPRPSFLNHARRKI
jgi:hypothetical protein